MRLVCEVTRPYPFLKSITCVGLDSTLSGVDGILVAKAGVVMNKQVVRRREVVEFVGMDITP